MVFVGSFAGPAVQSNALVYGGPSSNPLAVSPEAFADMYKDNKVPLCAQFLAWFESVDISMPDLYPPVLMQWLTRLLPSSGFVGRLLRKGGPHQLHALAVGQRRQRPPSHGV